MRASGDWRRCFATFIKGNLKLQASVNQASTTYPETDLTIDNITAGAASAVKAGMRVMVYRSNGTDFKGMTRVRYSGTISSTNIPIRELSRGVISISDNDIIKIYDDVRLSDKLVEAESTFDPDGIAYSDQGSNPPPVANSGGVWVGWDTMLPFLIKGSDSFNTDPDSGSTRTYSTTLPTGLTFDSGTSTSADPTVTGSAGEYEITHAVTDGHNSKVTTQYIPVRIHTAADPPYDCIIQSVESDPANGWNATARIFGTDLSVDDVPDGCLCVLWKEEYINGSQQSFGSDVANRSHIIMVGYVRRESSEADDQGVETLSFEIISPLARLAELVGYSKVMLNEATPDAWNEVKTLGVKRAIIQLEQFYSNLTEAGFDLLFHSTYFQDYSYAPFFIQRSTPFQQIQELADAVDARLVCRRNGRFEVHTVPRYINNSDRASVTLTLTLQDDDVLDYRYTRQHWRPVNIVEVRGFTDGTSGNQPLFSRWPGLSPGVGNESLIVERIIADTQADLNDRAGKRGADKDGIYVDTTGQMHAAIEIELTLAGAYDVFDWYCEFFKLDWTTLRREIDLSEHLFELVSVSIEFGEQGEAYTRLRGRTATYGSNGASYRPPDEDENTLPPYDPPDVDFPDFGITPPAPGSLPSSQMYRGTQRIAIITANSIYKTTNFGAASAVIWTAMALTGVSGTIKAWIPDGFVPGSGWLNTNSGIYYVDLITETITPKHTFGTASSFWGGDASFAQQNHVCWSDGVNVVYTTDNSTFTGVSAGSGGLPSAGGTRSGNHAVGVYYSSHQADTVYAGFFKTANHAVGYVSDDGGATWTELADPLIDVTGGVANFVTDLHAPWNNNADDGLVFFGANEVLYRSNSATPVDITPAGGGGQIANRGGIGTFVGNRNRLIVSFYNTPDSIWITNNAMAASPTWTEIVTAVRYNKAFFSGDDPNTIYFIAYDASATSAVGLATDGVTVINQMGNLEGTLLDMVGIAGW